jgi:hypothetical protein
MRHSYLLGAILALSIGPAAQAQPRAPPSQPISPTSSEEAQTGDQADASATVADFRPGMLVKDPSGVIVGRITRVGQAAEGETAVEIDLDGRRVNLSPNILSVDVSGSGARSSMTKAEIQGSSARLPP